MTKRYHEAETLAARWYQLNGWPFAEPVGAGRNGVDVTGVPGLLVEVKSAGLDAMRPHDWLRQVAEYRPATDERKPPVRFVVWRGPGLGPATIARWPVIMRLDEHTRLLHAAGYGDRKEIVR